MKLHSSLHRWRVLGMPFKVTSPAKPADTLPLRQFNIVDFPAPLLPIRATANMINSDWPKRATVALRRYGVVVFQLSAKLFLELSATGKVRAVYTCCHELYRNLPG